MTGEAHITVDYRQFSAENFCLIGKTPLSKEVLVYDTHDTTVCHGSHSPWYGPYNWSLCVELPSSRPWFNRTPLKHILIMWICVKRSICFVNKFIKEITEISFLWFFFSNTVSSISLHRRLRRAIRLVQPQSQNLVLQLSSQFIRWFNTLFQMDCS